jgi:cell fate regulator YaaT (PSP1 superfamily)
MRVMAVSFERYGRLYYLDPGEQQYRVGDKVLVPTDYGPEVAECVWAPEHVDESEFATTELPICAGPAEQSHLDRDAANRRNRAQAKLVAKRLIKAHGLPMKVAGVDFVDTGIDFDQLVVIYFTAPQRVDFRALVSELARSLQSRIDLRQVGARDAARLTNGLGNCGRELCCATFLSNLEPVSLRMAKLQDLPPNPMRISGACGRLMCCLKYEHPLYADYHRDVPAVGSTVTTEQGEAVVVGHSVPADSVQVRLRGTGAVASCSRESVCGSRAAYDTRTEDDTSSHDTSSDDAPAAKPGDERGPRGRTRRRR